MRTFPIAADAASLCDAIGAVCAAAAGTPLPDDIPRVPVVVSVLTEDDVNTAVAMKLLRDNEDGTRKQRFDEMSLIVRTLVHRAGGSVTVTAGEIEEAPEALHVSMDEKSLAVTITTRSKGGLMLVKP